MMRIFYVTASASVAAQAFDHIVDGVLQQTFRAFRAAREPARQGKRGEAMGGGGDTVGQGVGVVLGLALADQFADDFL